MARDSRPAALGELALDGAGLLAAVPLWLWWASWKGGYPPPVFMVGIGYLALAAVTLLGERRSLGALIESTPGLRTLDSLGRYP